MARFGTPMYKPLQTCWMLVTVENPATNEIKIRRWDGSTAEAIMNRARLAYPGCRVSFGRAVYVTV